MHTHANTGKPSCISCGPLPAAYFSHWLPLVQLLRQLTKKLRLCRSVIQKLRLQLLLQVLLFCPKTWLLHQQRQLLRCLLLKT